MGEGLKNNLDCGTYIADYLTPHADGELTGADLARAEAHVTQCAQCAAALAEERELKAVLHLRAGMLRTPPQVRGSILAALDAADRREATPKRISAPSRRPALVRSLRYAIPVALAAALAFVVVLLRNPTPAESYPAFDYATAHYDQYTDRFDPNVPSASPGDIAAAYVDHKMPGYLWNFQPSGYKLMGGRLEKMPDGRWVTNTFYRSDDGTILCSFVSTSGLKLPERDADEVGVHHFYRYRGHTICISYMPGGKYICILVSSKSMKAFMQDIMNSEI